jgi:prepilin-type processing-associated H-X9-DG protein
VCLSNQRQLITAITNYSAAERGHYPIGDMMGYDSNGNFQPRAHRWYIAVGPYLYNEGMPDNSLGSMAAPPIAGKNYSWDYNARGRVMQPTTNGGYNTQEVAAFGRANIYTCASTRGVVMYTTVQPGPFHGAWDVDYMYNGCVTGFGNYVIPNPNSWLYPPIRNLRRPSSAWALMDGDSWGSQHGYWSYGHWALGVGCEVTGGILPPGTTFNNSMHNTRHATGSDTSNLAFFDGHAELGWSFEKIADHGYGSDFSTRNAWWRGDPTHYAIASAVPY